MLDHLILVVGDVSRQAAGQEHPNELKPQYTNFNLWPKLTSEFFFLASWNLKLLKKTKHNKKQKQATITSFFVFSQIYLHLVFISKTHDICIKLFCSFVPFLVFFSQRLNDSLSYTLIPGFWYFCVDGCWITWQLYWSAEEKRAECKSKAVQLPVDLRSCSH